MSAEFRKLAAALRQVADEYEQKKLIKCAQIIRGARGLKLLARKLGEERLMSSDLMRKTADVLEKLADTFDADEHLRVQQIHAERRQMAQRIGEKYAEATGEELALDAIEKIATSDQDLVAIFTKLAERAPSSEAPEGMGAVTDIADGGDKAPASTNARYQNSREKHAAAEDAGERFLNWINS